MRQLFHKSSILNEPMKAWDRYKKEPESFGFPERITVELTNRCNLECFMCPRTKVDMKPGDMNIDLYRKIIDEASKHLPVCLVPFFRGESLLHQQFLKMLALAKDNGLGPIQLATNAYLLNMHRTKGILDLGVDFVSFSIDVNNKEIYEAIRQKSDYAKVFKNLCYFLEEKERRNKALPRTQVSAVRTEKNSDFIEDFINFWIDKVDAVRIYTAHSADGRPGSIEDDKEGDFERIPCLKLLTDMVIYYNGDVAICNHDWERKAFIGNVNNESIEQIWNSSAYSEIRKRHISGDFKGVSPCGHCSHWKAYCKEGCMIGEVYEKRDVRHSRNYK